MSSGFYSDSGPISCPAELDISGLKGKNVLVTGGSSGLGAAYVQAFSQAGASVTNADIKPPIGESFAQFVKCDVTSWDNQKAAFKAALSQSSKHGLDIVIANAGVSGSDSFFEDAPDAEEPSPPSLRILQANLIAVTYTAKLATFYMKRQDDSFDKCLILKSSIMGYLDTNGSPTYGASKHGVRGLMKVLRRRSGIRVNVVAPWYIATPLMNETVIQKLTPQLKAQGSDFAKIEDSVKAIMRIATDTSVNGRSLAVLPREETSSGYIDLDLDDFRSGSLCHHLQEICIHLTHRQLPSQQQ